MFWSHLHKKDAFKHQELHIAFERIESNTIFYPLGALLYLETTLINHMEPIFHEKVRVICMNYKFFILKQKLYQNFNKDF